MKSDITINTISKEKKDKFGVIISHYLDNRTEEHLEIEEIINEGVIGRGTIENDLYLPVSRALKGDVSPTKNIDEASYPLDIISTEANAIMNAKAATFDTSAIDVQLKPLFKTKPTGSADTSSLILLFNKFLNSYLSTPKFDFTFSDAIRDSRAYPMSITLIGWDDNIIVGSDTENTKGDITTKSIPIQDFWWDPASNSIEECEYVFTIGLYSYRRFKKDMSSYKDFNAPLLEALYYSDISGGITTVEQDPNLNSKQEQVNKGAIPLTTLFRKVWDPKEKRFNIKISFIAYGVYVIASTIWNISMLPFAILKEQGVPNSFTGVSSVMLALGKIKELHLADTVITSTMLKKLSTHYIVSQSSGFELDKYLELSTENLVSGQIINGDTTNAIALVPNPVIEADVVNIKQLLLSDIDRLTSATDLINGVTNSSITGAAVRNKEEQASIKENTSITELKKYLVRFTSIVIEFMKNNWFKTPDKVGSAMWLRYKNSAKDRGDDAYNFLEFTKKDLKHIVADVDIDCTLLRSSKKDRQASDLLQLYQIGLQYKSTDPIVTIQEIIEVLNIPNKDIILSRLKEDSQESKVNRAVMLVTLIQQFMADPNNAGVELQQAVLVVLEQMNAETLPTDNVGPTDELGTMPQEEEQYE